MNELIVNAVRVAGLTSIVWLSGGSNEAVFFVAVGAASMAVLNFVAGGKNE